jgi:4-hydroxy-4-methyl-2-oxoglutarate aldolase
MSESTVWLKVNRVDAAVCAAAVRTSVADLHEAMGLVPGRLGLMSARMRPLVRGLRIAGPAVTAYVAPGDNLMMHRALSLTQPGDVLVVVCPAETSGAQWGDVAAQYAAARGLAGVVVQGCIRDTDVLESMRFPVWSTWISPIHPEKSGHGLVNAPVCCDGVFVSPGDLVLADGDGVVVVPRRDAAAAVQVATERKSREDEAALKIAAGAAPWNLSGAAASYAKLNVREIDAAFDDHART